MIQSGGSQRPTAFTQDRSISDATERRNSDTDTTIRSFPFTLIRIPSKPSKASLSIRTLWPLPGRPGWLETRMSPLRMAAISASSTGSGTRPRPTTAITPGVITIGNRFEYRSGKIRNPEIGVRLYLLDSLSPLSLGLIGGRKVSYPLPASSNAVEFPSEFGPEGANQLWSPVAELVINWRLPLELSIPKLCVGGYLGYRHYCYILQSSLSQLACQTRIRKAVPWEGCIDFKLLINKGLVHLSYVPLPT